MFQNYFLVALRNIIKNKLFSVINTVGLAVGLAACIVIMLFVRNEISYDKHWAKADSLHRITTTFKIPGRDPFGLSFTPEVAKFAFPQYFEGTIKQATRLNPANPLMRKDGETFVETLIEADPEFATMFDLDVLQGDIARVLEGSGQIALSKTLAEKYFGDADPMGQTLTVTLRGTVQDMAVGAVYADLPENSVLEIPALSKWNDQNQPSFWFFVRGMVFFELEEGAVIEHVTSRLETFINEQINVPPAVSGGNDAPASTFIDLNIQAITDIYLNSSHLQGGEFKPLGDGARVTIFAAIAGLILVVGCINFMNLAIANSTKRAREVAMRKVMGAERRQLVMQFLGESTMIAFFGMLIAVVIVEATLPFLADLMGTTLHVPYTDWQVWAMIGGLVTFVGVLGGSYPALIISGFRPSRVLQANRSSETSGSSLLRGALVTFQFSVSIGLIVATGVVYGQMIYATNLNPGFTKENMLLVGGIAQPEAIQKRDALRAEVEKLNGVKSVTFAFDTPFSGNEQNQSLTVPGNAELGSVLIGRQTVDYDYFKTYEIPLIAGRSFDRNYSTDVFPLQSEASEEAIPTSAIILNESAVKRLGFGTPEEAIGKIVNMGVGQGVNSDFAVIGVAPDTYFKGLKTTGRPEFFALWPTNVTAMTVRFSGDPAALNEGVRALWMSMMGDLPFDSQFIEEVVAEQFALERNTGNLLGLFSMLTVIIACLGLYGLAAFTAERRTKEIGVRKVMGAQVWDIVKLLVWQFSKPVLIANLIAWPIAVWGMMQWLETFPYRIDAWLMAPLCLLAGMIALGIAWATVGGNAAKVARSNPILALRYE